MPLTQNGRCYDVLSSRWPIVSASQHKNVMYSRQTINTMYCIVYDTELLNRIVLYCTKCIDLYCIVLHSMTYLMSKIRNLTEETRILIILNSEYSWAVSYGLMPTSEPQPILHTLMYLYNVFSIPLALGIRYVLMRTNKYAYIYTIF